MTKETLALKKGAGILTPTSSGSTGDQAMIDAATGYLVSTLGRRVVIGPNAFYTRQGPESSGDPGKLMVMCNLADMILRCRSIGMVGADVLDGVYSSASVMKRLQVLNMAHRLGRKTRIFGCSWSLTPSEQIIAELRRANWLKLHARDPISQSRMEGVLERPVTLAADLAFLLKPEIRAEGAKTGATWIADRRAEGMTIFGLNMSGHTMREASDHGVGAFSGLVGRWLDADPKRVVLIIPHDRRPGLVGDMEVLGKLHAALRDRFGERLHMLPETLDAWDVKALVGKIDFVMTGRMHLAIAAMGMGTPALCTVYQGKFEGLMAHFALTDLTVSPAEVLAEQCDAHLNRITVQSKAIRADILARLPGIEALSRKNFEDM